MVLALGERTDNKMRPYNDLHVSPNIFYDIATNLMNQLWPKTCIHDIQITDLVWWLRPARPINW